MHRDATAVVPRGGSLDAIDKTAAMFAPSLMPGRVGGMVGGLGGRRPGDVAEGLGGDELAPGIVNTQRVSGRRQDFESLPRKDTPPMKFVSLAVSFTAPVLAVACVARFEPGRPRESASTCDRNA